MSIRENPQKFVKRVQEEMKKIEAQTILLFRKGMNFLFAIELGTSVGKPARFSAGLKITEFPAPATVFLPTLLGTFICCDIVFDPCSVLRQTGPFSRT